MHIHGRRSFPSPTVNVGLIALAGRETSAKQPVTNGYTLEDQSEGMVAGADLTVGAPLNLPLNRWRAPPAAARRMLAGRSRRCFIPIRHIRQLAPWKERA